MNHKWIAVIAGITAAVISFAGCAAAGNMEGKDAAEGAGSTAARESAYHKIDAEQAKEMLDGESGILLVDVRTPEEYAEKHIGGAANIPNETISDTPPAELPDKDARLVVYCRTGVRSRQAADKLVEMGYTNVYDMGGINDWPYETVSGSEVEKAME